MARHVVHLQRGLEVYYQLQCYYSVLSMLGYYRQLMVQGVQMQQKSRQLSLGKLKSSSKSKKAKAGQKDFVLVCCVSYSLNE